MFREKVFLGAFITFLLLSPAYAAGKSQTKCPVMGGEVNKAVYADYQGKRVYFCCPYCIEQFKAAPEKYRKNLHEEGVVLDEAPQEEPHPSEGEKDGGTQR
jgi:YHS domain-containing protein